MKLRTGIPYFVMGCWVVANGLNIVTVKEKIETATSETETLVYLLVSAIITSASTIVLVLWKKIMNLYDKREQSQESQIVKLEEMLSITKGENTALREQLDKKKRRK